MLYIQVIHEETIWSPQSNQVIRHKETVRLEYLLYKTLTKTTLAQLIVSSYPKSISMLYLQGIDCNILKTLVFNSVSISTDILFLFIFKLLSSTNFLILRNQPYYSCLNIVRATGQRP